MLYAIAYLAGYVLVSQERPLVLTVVYAAVALENVLANLVLIPACRSTAPRRGTSISELLAASRSSGRLAACGGTADSGGSSPGPPLAAGVAGAAMWVLRDELWAAIAAVARLRGSR